MTNSFAMTSWIANPLEISDRIRHAVTRVFGAVDTVDAPHPSRVELHGQIGIGRQKGMVTGYSRALASQLGSGSELWLTLTPKQFAQNVVERNFKDFAQKFAEPDS